MLIEFIVGILCTSALTELIRHDGRLSDFRTLMETLNGRTIQQFFKGVIGCGWCLSHWMGLLTTFILIGPHVLFPCVFTNLLFLLAFSMAIIRGANLVNDIFYTYCRTPRAAEREQDKTNGTL